MTDTTSIPLLEMEGVSKSYDGVQALRAANLEVLPGEIHGLLGENGAGKSTLMKILVGAVQRDEGTTVPIWNTCLRPSTKNGFMSRRGSRRTRRKPGSPA